MEGNCQVNNVVYKFDVTRPLPKKMFVGLAERERERERVREREREREGKRENRKPVSITTSYNRYSCKTTFSSYMWRLKRVSSETPN